MSSDAVILGATTLFAGFTPEEIAQILPALSPCRRQYQKGETLLWAGDATREIGVVLAGRIEAVKETRTGGGFTVARMGPGGIFGDVLSGSHTKSPVTVRAAADSTVLYLAYAGLLSGISAPGAEHLHRRLLSNLVAVISDKYFALDSRVDLLLTRGLRRRCAAFLLREAGRRGNPFALPYGRAGLAEYLGCERSALSRELSRMAADGLLETRRRWFFLPDIARLKALL